MSSILPARRRLPRAAAADAQARRPQPGRGPARREEREEEALRLSPGVRLRGGQGFGRRERLRPRAVGRAGLGRRCRRGADRSSGPPRARAAQSPRGHRALTLRVGAPRTRAKPSFSWKDAPDTANE